MRTTAPFHFVPEEPTLPQAPLIFPSRSLLQRSLRRSSEELCAPVPLRGDLQVLMSVSVVLDIDYKLPKAGCVKRILVLLGTSCGHTRCLLNFHF